MVRFDDRLPPRGKDGDDFQRFVWEALRSGHFESLTGRYVRPYFTAGNDGGIDHVAVGDDDQIIFESKFFGKNRGGQPSDDWTALSRRLGENLRVNAGRAYKDVDRLYKPWFDINRRVKGYWFCTSGDFKSGAQTELRDKIKAFFSEFAEEPSLAHLASLNVEVLGWNDFNGVVTANPALHFRWFGNLPVGLRPLRSIAEGKTFRKFLDEGALPFFSREEFNRKAEVEGRTRLTDEPSILSTLLGGEEQLGLVLSGPGGLGKTRLALQLGLDAESSGWLVLQIERHARREAIEGLARQHASLARILLIIDYAEAAGSLFGLVQEMERANADGGHRFRFIATCRASALSAVKEALEEIDYRLIQFSGEADDRYARWVVANILAGEDIPGAHDIAEVCGGLPVLAAFAVFLFKQYREKFDAQFGQIHRGDDFAQWAEKRLRLALQARGLAEQSTRRPLATIAARLPLRADEYLSLRSLNNDTVRLLDILQDDRWIEPDGEGRAAAHDIFADAIIARYVFEATQTVTDRAGDVLTDAMEAGAFERALIAFNRLAAHKQFDEIDGLAIIRRAHARNPGPVINARDLLLQVRIPSYQTCIRLLGALPDLANAVAADESCDLLLSYLAEDAAASKGEVWCDEAKRILQPLLDRAIARHVQSNTVVRRALRLLPERHRDRALEWIRSAPTRSETHFLFVAWLGAGLSIEDISADIVTWLFCGGNADPKASFVFRAWLDAAAKLDPKETAAKIALIKAHVLAWLGQPGQHGEHGMSEAARFVYKSWLDSAAKLKQDETAAKIAAVEAHVLAWLGQHEKSEAAAFVYPPWLDAGGSPDLIRSSMTAWFGANPDHQESDFIIKAWLEAKGDFAVVRDPALAWLKRNSKNPDAVYILKFIVKERDLPSRSIRNIISWCVMFKNNMDTICRIQPVFSHFAQGTLEMRLSVATLLVLKNLQTKWLDDRGVRDATLATIGSLAWKARFVNGIEARLDRIHANILLNSAAYSANSAATTPNFALNPSLAVHVASMVERQVIDPGANMAALKRFLDWLAAWPLEKQPSLRAALRTLDKNCPSLRVWDRVGIAEPARREEPSAANPPELENLLEQLDDMQMTPHDWSNLWEKAGWRYFPGEPRLVALAGKWMYKAAPDASWPWVWEKLFVQFPEDEQYTDVALWWLEHRGPRDRGAWTFVWLKLWGSNCARDRLDILGRGWLHEYEGRHKYWQEVWSRLNPPENQSPGHSLLKWLWRSLRWDTRLGHKARPPK